MKYCKHLKKRKNKPYCILLKQEIPFCRCRECVNKEYKINNKNFTIFEKNDTFCIKNAKNSKKNIQNLKNKSKKLAKLERRRKSVFTDDLEHCYLCGNKKDDLHELLGGRNRLNCIKLGYIIPVCRLCHSRIQDDIEFKMYWAKKVQLHYEEFVGARGDFIRIFRRNYL